MTFHLVPSDFGDLHAFGISFLICGSTFGGCVGRF